MHAISKKAGTRLLILSLTLSASSVVSAQEQQAPADPNIIVDGKKIEGPEIKGVISARNGDRIKVTGDDGTSTIIAVNETTKIKARSGLFGGNRNAQGPDALLNGIPVTIKTVKMGDGMSEDSLVASQISFRNTDLKTATMIRNATDQRFAEQSAATEELRGHMADIDKYNVKSTTNVHFETGKTTLSEQDKADLCTTASTAQAQENALMLVVGYTDSTGDDDFNQQLSEKRAARVINYLQQACGWKPYRMLTPTGMSKADPAATNETEEGKAQNRRVAVNILVSKSLDGL